MSMMRTGGPVETLTGGAVLAVAGLFLFYAYTTVGGVRTDGYDITARFDQIGSLVNGSDVRLSGIKIGAVTGQRLDPHSYEAVVSMSINAGVDLPDDSSARITPESLLGGSYIAIQPGGATDMLSANGEIQYTQGSVDLLSLIGQAIFSAKDGGDGN